MQLHPQNCEHAGFEPGGKLLSVCLTGRNDDYGGDFSYRMSLSINCLADAAARIGRLDDVEVVVTDWNSKVPLANELTLTDNGAAITRFAYVPPEVAEPNNHPGSEFHTTRALNTGLNIARGRFMMVMPADVLIPKHPLGRLVSLLEGQVSVFFDIGRSLMLIPRYFVPREFAPPPHRTDMLEKYLFLNSYAFRKDSVFSPAVSSSAGAILFSRQVLETVGFFNEALGGCGCNDCDFGLRANAHFPSVDVSQLGIISYDIERMAATVLWKRHVAKKEALDRWQTVCCTGESTGTVCPLQGTQLQRAEARSEEGARAADCSPARRPTTKLEDIVSCELRMMVIADRGRLGVQDEVKACHYLLAWLAHRATCFNYLEYGEEGTRCPLVVTAGNRCASATVILPSDGTAPDSHATATPLAFTPYRLGHRRVHIRFVSGDPNTAWSRLQSNSLGLTNYDIVLFRPDQLAQPVQQVDAIVARINDGGAIVLTASSSEQYSALSEHIRREHRRFASLSCPALRVGLFLDGEIDRQGMSDEAVQELLMRAWAPVLFRPRAGNPRWMLRLVASVFDSISATLRGAARLCAACSSVSRSLAITDLRALPVIVRSRFARRSRK